MKDSGKGTLILGFVVFAAITASLFLSHFLPKPEVQRAAERHLTAAAFGKLPIRFEENQGQTDGQVNFIARGAGYSMFLTPDGAALTLSRPKSGEAHAIRMRLTNPNPPSRISRSEELPGTTNYFIGNDRTAWRTQIKSFGRVRYSAVYQGIDLVYHGNQQQLEYDFEMAPGSDPNRIEMNFEGAEDLKIDGDGQLLLHTSAGDLVQHRPVAYQNIGADRKEVPVRYVLTAEKSIRFQIGAYDETQALVIDPVLAYSTYLGASGLDEARGVTVDSSGNAYVVGSTASSNFPVTTGAFQTSNGGTGGSQDVWVAKLNAAGTQLVYSTYLGGSDGDSGRAITVDSSGNAYITGLALSTNFPVTTGAFQTSRAGVSSNSDAVVTKLNSSGTALLFSTYLGGSAEDDGIGIATDSAGSVYVAGFTKSTDFPVANAFQSSNGGGGEFDAFVTKLNSAGSSLVYSTYIGGSARDALDGLAVDSSGNVYIVGITKSTNYPVANAYQAAFQGGTQDGFVTKLNAAGSALVYSTYLGGTGTDEASALVVDSTGRVTIAGSTDSTDFPLQNALQTSNAGGDRDAFVTKFNAAGSALVYSTYFGGSGGERATAIGVDAAGSVYIAGHTTSSNLRMVDALQSSINGADDAYVAKFTSSGSTIALDYSTYWGGTSEEFVFGLAVDAQQNVYVAGWTESTNFPTSNALQSSSTGREGFLFKLSVSPAGPVQEENPLPVLKAITPTQTTISATDLEITLTGSGFIQSSVVNIGSTSLVTRFRDQGSLSATVPASLLSSAAALRVVVVNPQPGGGISQPATLAVVYARPTITSVAPTFLLSGTQAANLTIRGNGFTSASTAQVNGASRTSTVSSPSQLTVSLNASDVSGAGTLAVAVSNPSPGGGSSSVSVSVFNPTDVRAISAAPGVSSITSSGSSPSTVSGYAGIQPGIGNSAPYAIARLALSRGGAVVNELNVPAMLPIKTGRALALVTASVNTAIAIANPNADPVSVAFFFTDSSGKDFGNGTFTISGNGQLAKFLNESPFNAPMGTEGTITFSTTLPVGVLVGRTILNARGDFLITPLPIVDVSAPPVQTLTMPYFADGAGWSTTLVLINTTDVSMRGTVSFNNGVAGSSTNLNGASGNSFDYEIPPRTSRRLSSAGSAPVLTTGSLRILPTLFSGQAPSAFEISSFQRGGDVISEVGITTGPPKSSVQAYVESTGSFGTAALGSVESAFVLANTGMAAVTAKIEVLSGTTSPVSTTLSIPAQGQVATFLKQIPGFESLPTPLQAVIRISAADNSANLLVSEARARYNERGELLMSSLPLLPDSLPPADAELLVPYIADGGGYTTSFIFMNTTASPAGITLRTVGPSGQPLIF